MTKHTFPFQIFAVAPEGVTVPVGGRTHDFASDGYLLHAGHSTLVTESVYAATIDSTGKSWLDQTDEEQISRYGHLLFGIGEVSAAAKTVADEARAKIVADEVNNLKRSNPGLAKRSGAAARLDRLEAELLELSGS